jgi:hypothetical protein
VQAANPIATVIVVSRPGQRIANLLNMRAARERWFTGCFRFEFHLPAQVIS